MKNLEKTYHTLSKLENKYLFMGRHLVSEDQGTAITSLSTACGNDPNGKRECNFKSSLLSIMPLAKTQIL